MKKNLLLLQFLAQISAQSSMLTNRKIKPPSQQSPSINSTIKTSSGGNLVLANKQAAPKFSYVVWDEQGMVCILAKFEATLTITFYTPSGAHQLIEKIPIDAKSKGRCDYLLDEKPVLDVTWIGGFTFRIIFEKIINSDDNSVDRWGINSIDLLYNTADSLFRGSVDGGKKVARTKPGSLGMFTTAMGKSYFCPSPPIINLYESKTGKPSVVVRLTNVHLQAFQIEMGKFAPISRCSQVSFGSGVAAPLYVSLEQDDSVPVVVGTLTVIVSILVIVGYAVYKSWVFKPVDYDTMI
ncbi:Lysosome-associated membrane glycoprotein 5 [Dermatophagoides pteronyssinus]|uniref:Lysosome-associated membrane glycoprotein 5 n=1 Tax=Dermatophagoides pteronyssinus TaxID=6956 RepID=A0ABQ8JVK1_DERPT|nr:Lysosome-associated membrane glycoprotein 5 [Dermatophagoides pteronyssinus]